MFIFIYKFYDGINHVKKTRQHGSCHTTGQSDKVNIYGFDIL